MSNLQIYATEQTCSYENMHRHKPFNNLFVMTYFGIAAVICRFHSVQHCIEHNKAYKKENACAILKGLSKSLRFSRCLT